MKKKSLSSLKLTKRRIANFKGDRVKGGRMTFRCTARTMSGCY